MWVGEKLGVVVLYVQMHKGSLLAFGRPGEKLYVPTVPRGMTAMAVGCHVGAQIAIYNCFHRCSCAIVPKQSTLETDHSEKL